MVKSHHMMKIARFISVAVFLGAFVPSVASAAMVTVTQQGTVSTSAPLGAQRAVFIEATIKAECDADVTVSSIDVKHRGLGEASDLVRVYLTDDVTRLSHTKSLSSSDRSATLEFVQPLVVKKCTTKRIQVRGDFSSEAAVAGEHGMLIESVVADAPVVLSSDGSSRITARPLRKGVVSAAFLPLTKGVLFGKNRTVARIRLEADNIANHTVSAITLTNLGKARDTDLQNIGLYDRSGTAYTTVAPSLEGNIVRLTFTPALKLSSRSSVLLEVRADVLASKKKTIRFVVEEQSDIEY